MQVQTIDDTPKADAHTSEVGPSYLRRERLRDDLLVSVEAIECMRQDLLPDGFVADYIALRWLELQAGELRLTSTGAALCDVLRQRRRCHLIGKPHPIAAPATV